jgi:NAD(P)-dependent dehydrogenase (short-subunit alcohol dehydrogenase family)
MLLEGKAAAIVGVGPGLGRSTALLFAQHGADVALGARTTETADAIAAEIHNTGRKAYVGRCDMTDGSSCRSFADAATNDLGKLDILVVNGFREGPHRSVLEADLDDWRTTMEVNFFGALHAVRAAAPHITAAGGGHIVLVNTMSAMTMRAQPRFGGYAAAKAAVAQITRTLAAELGPSGIRVNGVFPGFIWADAVQLYFAHKAHQRGVDPQVVYDEVAGEAALRHIPTADEVARTILFFASDLSAAVTGEALAVNAGDYVQRTP